MSTAPPKAETHLAGLDGLRGVACLLVFFYHLRWRAQPSMTAPLVLPLGTWNAEPWLRCCDVGVAIFFVLSGLLLSLPFWRAILAGAPAPPFTPYFWRRVCRIVPAYYATLVVVYLLRGGTYTLSGALDFLLHATFLHNFADFSYHSIHPVLWTIGIEFQFYLLLPLLMAVVAWLRRFGGTAAAVLTLIAATWALDVAVQAILDAYARGATGSVICPPGSEVISGTIFSYLKLFAFGIAGGWAVLEWRLHSRAWDAIAALSVAGLFYLITFGEEAGWRRTWTGGWPLNGIILAVLAATASRSRVLASALSVRWLTGVGTISYGIYLWHELVQRAFFDGTIRNHLHGWPLFAVGGAATLALTILFAWLSWRWIEQPAMQAPCPFAK